MKNPVRLETDKHLDHNEMWASNVNKLVFSLFSFSIQCNICFLYSTQRNVSFGLCFGFSFYSIPMELCSFWFVTNPQFQYECVTFRCMRRLGFLYSVKCSTFAWFNSNHSNKTVVTIRRTSEIPTVTSIE